MARPRLVRLQQRPRSPHRPRHNRRLRRRPGHRRIRFRNQFDQDYLYADDSLNGSGYSRTLPEYESLVSVEGWADFVAARSWWTGANMGSLPVIAGNLIELNTPQASTCSANSGLILQATKGFWDLIDINDEPAAGPASSDDTYNNTASDLVEGWNRFADGTANRQQDEVGSGLTDPDGMNLRDYYNNNAGFPGFTASGFSTTLLNHNCTGSQTDL